MDREQKKEIHLKITQLLDNHCKGCGFRSVDKSYLFCWENCHIGMDLRMYGDMLEGKQTKHDIVFANPEQPAQQDHPLIHGTWSEEEEFYLLNHASVFDVVHLAQKLNRPYKDVYNKLRGLKRKRKISYFKTRKWQRGLSS